jgi:hypothetical protein
MMNNELQLVLDNTLTRVLQARACDQCYARKVRVRDGPFPFYLVYLELTWCTMHTVRADDAMQDLLTERSGLFISH